MNNCRSYILPVLFFLSLFVNSRTIAQVKVTNDVPDTLTLHSDPRLALITGFKEVIKNVPGRPVGSIRTGKGFRVLIYSGIDRKDANDTKADFMRRFPQIRVYMTYALPQYRVKAGDFTSRQEAYQLYEQLNNIYSPCMIVPDIVEINTFRK